MNLREAIEQSLGLALEDPKLFGLPVVLVSPDGIQQSLYGKIVYDHKVFDPEIGSTMVFHRPVVTLRKSSMRRIPKAGEKWICKIPINPSLTAPVSTFIVQDPETDGSSIGFIRLFLTATKQASP